MAELTIVVRTHGFIVRQITPRGRTAVERFARRYVQYGIQRVRNQYSRTALKVFAAATKDRTEFFFHINQLAEFKQVLDEERLTGSLVEYIEEPVPKFREIIIELQSKWKARDDQLPAIEYIEAEEPRAKMLTLQTGQGKSFITMKSISDLKALAAIVVRPAYIEKWIEDLQRTYVLTDEDIMVVRGANQLMALLMLAQDNALDCKIILISNKTLQNWLLLYEKIKHETADMGYACMPHQLYEMLQVGIRVNDEFHQDFHLNFKLDTYSNVWRSVGLSATMLFDDPFVNRMAELAYPTHKRFQGAAYKKYVDAFAATFLFEQPGKFRYKDPRTGYYSHFVFEQSLMRNEKALNNYLRMVKRLIDSFYLGDRYTYTKGEKCLIYATSIDFCTFLTDWLEKTYPEHTSARFVEDDPYENLKLPDFRVSNFMKAGAAQDIDNLTTVIMLSALNSSQSNVQGLGRLRELKSGKTPRFVFLTCLDIPKQVEYHERKLQLLKDRALTTKVFQVPGFI